MLFKGARHELSGTIFLETCINLSEETCEAEFEFILTANELYFLSLVEIEESMFSRDEFAEET